MDNVFNFNPTETNENLNTKSEKEKKIVKMVESMLTKAKRHRSAYDKNWGDHYKFFPGRTYALMRCTR